MGIFRRPRRLVDFRLENAESINADQPRTFFIPSRVERETLRPGDLAKLLLQIVEPDEGMPATERMWVQVVETRGSRYIGSLDNSPEGSTSIGLGSRIDFGPEHVIATPEDWPLLNK